MELKDMAFEIEELQIRAEIIHSMQNALYAAIFRQKELSHENYDWAFVALGEMTKEQEDRMKELKKLTFDCLGKEVKDADRKADKKQTL